MAGITVKENSHKLVLIKLNSFEHLWRNLNEDELVILTEESIDINSRIQIIVFMRLKFLFDIGDYLERSNIAVANFSWGLDFFSLKEIIQDISNSLSSANGAV